MASLVQLLYQKKVFLIVKTVTKGSEASFDISTDSAPGQTIAYLARSFPILSESVSIVLSSKSKVLAVKLLPVGVQSHRLRGQA